MTDLFDSDAQCILIECNRISTMLHVLLETEAQAEDVTHIELTKCLQIDRTRSADRTVDQWQKRRNGRQMDKFFINVRFRRNSFCHDNDAL